MTNGDKIRKMNNRDLCRFLYEIGEDTGMVYVDEEWRNSYELLDWLDKEIEEGNEESEETAETYDDILRIFKQRYKIKKINDFRPAPFSFEDSRKAGIKVWFDNGDEIIFIPKEWKELNTERLKTVKDMGLEDAYDKVAKQCRVKYEKAKGEQESG